MELFETPSGSFVIERSPGRQSALRGWSAAEELVVATLLEAHDLAAFERGAIVVNPGSGAVPIALAAAGVLVSLVSDSAHDVAATWANAEANGLSRDEFELIDFYAGPDGTDESDGATASVTPVDLVVVNVPKRLSLLDAQLRLLRPYLDADTVVIGTGMTRHIHTSTVEAFDAVVGPTLTSLATKKARLILPTVDQDRTVDGPAAPTTFTAHGLTLINDANGFSPKHIDPGTDLLIRSLGDFSRLEASRRDGHDLEVADVGCGNGIIGAAVLARVPESTVLFCDESFAAVRSARETVAASVPRRLEDSTFAVGDALRSFIGVEAPANGSLDVVLSNPPFHQDHAVTDEVAWGIFTSAHRSLRVGGQLIIVGNRHLNYHVKLKRLFGPVDTLGSNSKFVVLAATRR